ncbi:MAG: homocysteine S-methyltransferase family protein [Pseudomonadota bacterium]
MKIVLMDGGMGQELIARSKHPVHPLWSTQVMRHEPEIVREVHRDYLEAGARVLTVNAYAMTGPRLARDGEAESFDELQNTACALAAEARGSRSDVTLAGCLPPLIGSYRPDMTPEPEVALAEYRRIVAAQAPHVDVFLAETMPNAAEAFAAVTAAAESGKPIWVAWTLKDGGDAHLRSGERIAEAAAAIAHLPVAAHLVNCCHPESVDAALPELAALNGPVGAYANGFVSVAPLQPGGTVDALTAREDLGPDPYADFALGWVDGGATILGGCCEVGPAHIATLAERLTAAGHEIVGMPE